MGDKIVDWDELLREPRQGALNELASLLEGLSADARIRVLSSANRAQLRGLFLLCRDRPARLDRLVPTGLADGESVTHDGVNSLSLFRRFQKRLSCVDGRVIGHNVTPFSFAVTPGYFRVVHVDGGLAFDYAQSPERVPKGWPRVVENTARLGRFVYAGLFDELREVSPHVTVGTVLRHGAVEGIWFALSRR